MKRNIVGILALAGLLTSSCMDGFLERNPFGSIDETTFFTEPEHADLAAIACYSKLQKLNAHWGDAQLELGMTGDFSAGENADRRMHGAESLCRHGGESGAFGIRPEL